MSSMSLSIPGSSTVSGNAVLTKGKRHLGNVTGWVSVTVLAFFILAAIFAPVIAPHLPNAQDLTKRLLPPAWADGGSAAYLFGTDELGRDILSRVIYGSQVSMSVGVLAAL